MTEPMMIIALLTILLVVVQLWLFQREITFQQARRQGVPVRLAERFTAESYALAVDYAIAKLRTAITGVVLDGMLLLGWTVGGALFYLHDLWSAVEIFAGYSEITLLVSVVLVQGGLHRLLAAYRQFVVERRFGFGRMSAGLFLRDTCLQGVLLTLVAGGLAWGGIGILSSFSIAEWSGVWLMWVSFSWGRSWLYPVVVTPLFNQFNRLDDDELASRIKGLLDRTGCGPAKVFVMDGSRRSSHGNAHVAGLRSARRVVLLDTLLETLDRDEVVAVLAHEVGHISHAHIAKYQIFQAAAAFFWVVGFGLFLTPSELFEIGDTTHPGAGTALATLWLATPVFNIIVRPLVSWMIRAFEYQADEFVRTHDKPDALRAALLKLYARNSSVEGSDPMFGFVYLSHPGLPERLARLFPEVA